jgi:phage FluMu protein Com
MGDARYRCAYCKQVLTRPDGKAWIRSYCERTQRYVRLMKQKAGASK